MIVYGYTATANSGGSVNQLIVPVDIPVSITVDGNVLTYRFIIVQLVHLTYQLPGSITVKQTGTPDLDLIVYKEQSDSGLYQETFYLPITWSGVSDIVIDIPNACQCLANVIIYYGSSPVLMWDSQKFAYSNGITTLGLPLLQRNDSLNVTAIMQFDYYVAPLQGTQRIGNIESIAGIGVNAIAGQIADSNGEPHGPYIDNSGVYPVLKNALSLAYTGNSEPYIGNDYPTSSLYACAIWADMSRVYTDPLGTIKTVRFALEDWAGKYDVGYRLGGINTGFQLGANPYNNVFTDWELSGGTYPHTFTFVVLNTNSPITWKDGEILYQFEFYSADGVTFSIVKNSLTREGLSIASGLFYGTSYSGLVGLISAELFTSNGDPLEIGEPEEDVTVTDELTNIYITSFVDSEDTVSPSDVLTDILYPILTSAKDDVSPTDEIVSIILVNPSPSQYFSTVCNAVISGYKWLTQSLLTAQQKSNLRPYLECKIIDDELLVDSILTAPNNPKKGGAVKAPDGSMLVAGLYNGDTGGFWKITDDIGHLSDSPDYTFFGGSLSSECVFSISVSDFVNGQYHIDIFLSYVFGGNNRLIFRLFSVDSGNNFSFDFPGYYFVEYGTNKPATISAGKPTFGSNGEQYITFFYSVTDSQGQSNIFYYHDTDMLGTPTAWNQQVNTSDWDIHSLDNYYADGKFHIIFSALHKVLESSNGMYSLYHTSIEDPIPYHVQPGIPEVLSQDVWSSAIEILPSLSSSAQNQNSFTYPKVTFDGETVFLTCHASVVSSISTGNTTSVITTDNYFLMKSQDFTNFTYPVIISYTDGTLFTDDYSTYQSYSGYDFVPFNGYYYLVGNGKLWRFAQHNVIADLSKYVIRARISETQNSPINITLEIANMNNQWFGGTVMLPNSSAIAKNKKIYFSQGYYNSLGVPEVAPRNVFFIDEINQSVSASTNSLIISGRDSFKKLNDLVTKYTYNLNGIKTIYENFSSTNLNNWNQISGTWNTGEVNLLDRTEKFGVLYNDNQELDDNERVITLPLSAEFSEGYTFSLVLQMPNTSITPTDGLDHNVYSFYAMYVDQDNWLRMTITTHHTMIGNLYWGYAIEKSISGVITILQERKILDGLPLRNWDYGTEFYPILIKKYDYFKYDFIIGSNKGDYYSSTLGKNVGYGNANHNFNYEDIPYSTDDRMALPLSLNADPTLTPIQIDITQDFIDGSLQTPGSVGIGAGYIPHDPNEIYGAGFNPTGCTNSFTNVKFIQHGPSLSIKDILHNLAVKAGIFDFKDSDAMNDNLFDESKWTGTFTAPNRVLTVPSWYSVMRNDMTMKNGEIEFQAKISPENQYYYGFGVFVHDDGYSNQSFFVDCYNNVNESFIRIGGYATGGDSSPSNYYSGVPYNALNYDFTKWNKYKISFTDNTFHGFINDKLICSWLDNSMYSTPTDGNFGFFAEGATVEVKNIKSSLLYQQIPSFTLNPGDDIYSTITNLLDTIRIWMFTDIWGRIKTVFLNSTDDSTYTYQDRIISQNTENSDKEFTNQVTVYGLNTSAIAQDLSSISTTGRVKELMIIDYKITSYEDALSRANYELINSKKTNNQSSPSQPINVGAEIYDSVTVINTGNNSTSVDSVLRVYSDDFTVSARENNLTIDVGNI